jgi:hypothetical protein
MPGILASRITTNIDRKRGSHVDRAGDINSSFKKPGCSVYQNQGGLVDGAVNGESEMRQPAQSQKEIADDRINYTSRNKYLTIYNWVCIKLTD